MNEPQCTDDFCIAPYATQQPLPSSADFGVVGARDAHRPAATEFRKLVMKKFYDTNGDVTAREIHEQANEELKTDLSFALVLKIRAEMNREKLWPWEHPNRNVQTDGYPWEGTND
jgi:hypothetical protein